MREKQRLPATSLYLGFTGQTSPSNPPFTMLLTTTRPTEPLRTDAPTTATDLG